MKVFKLLISLALLLPVALACTDGKCGTCCGGVMPLSLHTIIKRTDRDSYVKAWNADKLVQLRQKSLKPETAGGTVWDWFGKEDYDHEWFSNMCTPPFDARNAEEIAGGQPTNAWLEKKTVRNRNRLWAKRDKEVARLQGKDDENVRAYSRGKIAWATYLGADHYINQRKKKIMSQRSCLPCHDSIFGGPNGFCGFGQVCAFARGTSHNQCVTLPFQVRKDHHSIHDVTLQCDRMFPPTAKPIRFQLCIMATTLESTLIDQNAADAATRQRIAISATKTVLNGLAVTSNMAAIGAALGLCSNPFTATFGIILLSANLIVRFWEYRLEKSLRAVKDKVSKMIMQLRTELLGNGGDGGIEDGGIDFDRELKEMNKALAGTLKLSTKLKEKLLNGIERFEKLVPPEEVQKAAEPLDATVKIEKVTQKCTRHSWNLHDVGTFYWTGVGKWASWENLQDGLRLTFKYSRKNWWVKGWKPRSVKVWYSKGDNEDYEQAGAVKLCHTDVLDEEPTAALQSTVKKDVKKQSMGTLDATQQAAVDAEIAKMEKKRSEHIIRIKAQCKDSTITLERDGQHDLSFPADKPGRVVVSWPKKKENRKTGKLVKTDGDMWFKAENSKVGELKNFVNLLFLAKDQVQKCNNEKNNPYIKGEALCRFEDGECHIDDDCLGMAENEEKEEQQALDKVEAALNAQHGLARKQRMRKVQESVVVKHMLKCEGIVEKTANDVGVIQRQTELPVGEPPTTVSLQTGLMRKALKDTKCHVKTAAYSDWLNTKRDEKGDDSASIKCGKGIVKQVNALKALKKVKGQEYCDESCIEEMLPRFQSLWQSEAGQMEEPFCAFLTQTLVRKFQFSIYEKRSSKFVKTRFANIFADFEVLMKLMEDTFKKPSKREKELLSGIKKMEKATSNAAIMTSIPAIGNSELFNFDEAGAGSWEFFTDMKSRYDSVEDIGKAGNLFAQIADAKLRPADDEDIQTLTEKIDWTGAGYDLG